MLFLNAFDLVVLLWSLSKPTDIGERVVERSRKESIIAKPIDHFTVVDLVTWPLNGSEASVDLVLIQTSLLLLCKSSCSYAN